MINENVYKEISKKGLLLDHYYILALIKTGRELPANKRVQGFKNILQKKGYLDEEFLITDIGRELIIEDAEPTGSTTTTTTQAPVKIPKKFIFPQNNIALWAEELHKKCQDKMIELIGKKQMRAVIDKKGYSFLPNAIDLGNVLFKAISVYKLTDYGKIEKTIIKHIEKCNKENHWFPLMQYFIFKNGSSLMVTRMEEEDDQDYSQDKGNNQKFI